MSSAANPQPNTQPPYQQQNWQRGRRRDMARQRRRNYGSYDVEDWQDRWRDEKDADIAQLQRDYITAAQAMIEVREWIKSHDKQHESDRAARAHLPDDVRGWIATAISVMTLLLMLYLQSHR